LHPSKRLIAGIIFNGSFRMKKSKKYTSSINRQLTVFAIGIICIVITLPTIIKGNFDELFRMHPGKLRNMPLVLFLILGLVLIMIASINLIKTVRRNKRSDK